MEVKHIGIFGRRNAGKSSLINALLGQDFAIVSDKPGTTTDPVKKRMEIFGVGPVQLIDTAGIDDCGDLGEQRVNKTLKVIGEVDMGLLLFTNNIFSKEEMDILVALKELDVPVCIVHNKSDLQTLDADLANDLNNKYNCDVIEFSCNLKGDEKKDAIDMLEAFIIKGLMQGAPERTILQGLVNKGDKVVLVCPIDSQAPSQRLILPQVMAIRDILDNAAVAVVLQPEQLPQYISENKDINLVVTDSQIFKKVSDIVPSDILLTSFSVLMARMKGPFDDYLLGVKELDKLKDGDKVLILESCTHRSTCEDIGRVKIPAMITKYVSAMEGKDVKLNFDFIPGLDELPPKEILASYSLAVQCGGCMVTRRQLANRVRMVKNAGVKVTNYGMAIACVSGILKRAVEFLKNGDEQ